MERVAGGPGTCGNGVFRIRLNPAEYAQPTCYIPDPLRPLRTTMQDAVYFATQFMARTVSAVRSHGPFLERLVEEIDLSAAIDAQPYDDSIRDTIDFDAVRRSPIRLSIFATVWETGAARRFDNAAGTVTAQAVQASASLPGVFRLPSSTASRTSTAGCRSTPRSCPPSPPARGHPCRLPRPEDAGHPYARAARHRHRALSHDRHPVRQ